ncbi:glycosyltransferase [Geobacter pelophilus]|uniref:Glycosyltransferase n=1 Tax=Geoanaerobacter pelophilus TaxID=60036 RepID=A0AAW4KXE6_9BACT|nr:glycosyltransferase family 2 protein [Geoanaerobacter pelophilus]MBT0663014.1 glycosyltransferase [Geoanaerobacter pelophilus]
MSSLHISVITPSYNQGNFIKETIDSVIAQNYDNYEHIVIDGLSADGTMDVLKEYPHLNVICEKDSGQSNALNKGFKMAQGDIIAWINSDDTYEPGTFQTVAQYFEEHPDCSVLFGDFHIIDVNGRKLHHRQCREFSLKELLQKGNSLVGQPAVFFRKSVLDTIGYLDESLHLGMDYDFFIRMRMKYDFRHISCYFANFRKHLDSKTIDGTLKDIEIGYKISKKFNGGRYLMLYINVLIRKIYYFNPTFGHGCNYFRYRMRK